MPNGQTITLRDIAEAAGVSVGTASMALNEKNGIAPLTRQRVLEAASKLGYKRFARREVVRRGMVSVLVERTPVSLTSDPFNRPIVLGMEAAARQLGYRMTLEFVGPEDHPQPDHWTQGRTAGLVILGGGDLGADWVRTAAESGLPVVVVDHSAPDVGLPTVVPDNFSGAYEATRHLLELGHERIGFIRGPSKYWTLGERMSGYLLAMQQRGLPLDPSLIPPRISHGEQKGYGEMQLLLDLSDRPTAVFAVSDKTAMGAYQAAADRGLSIPDDVSVVGFDDIESARAMTPPLTTVHVSGDILGRVAIKRLAGILNDRTAGEQMSVKWTIPTKLVIRESTTPPPSSSCHREGADGGKTRLFEVCCAE